MWVPCSHILISPEEGTHKGCPYDPVFYTPNLNSYKTTWVCLCMGICGIMAVGILQKATLRMPQTQITHAAGHEGFVHTIVVCGLKDEGGGRITNGGNFGNYG